MYSCAALVCLNVSQSIVFINKSSLYIVYSPGVLKLTPGYGTVFSKVFHFLRITSIVTFLANPISKCIIYIFLGMTVFALVDLGSIDKKNLSHLVDFGC